MLAGLLVAPLVPLPPPLLAWLSPRAFMLASAALPGWPERVPFDDLRQTLDLQPARLALALQLPPAGAWRPLALVPHGSLLTLSIGVAYALIAAALARYPWSDGGDRAVAGLLSCLIAVGFFEALYGLLQVASGHTRIYWFECPRPGCMGTYVNKDHYAGLLEMIFPITLARTATWYVALRRAAAALRQRSGSARARVFLDLHSAALGRLICAAAIALLMLVALAVSGSRSAFAATVGALLALLPFVPATQRPQRWVRAGGAAAVAVLVVLWLSFPQLSGRLSKGDALRPLMAGDTLAMARDFPLLGVGAGNFASTFPYYRERSVALWEFGVSNAHCDYLEWLAEVGVAAALLSLLLLVGLGRRVLRALRSAQSWTPQAVNRWGLAVGVMALLLHSLTDFNLHVPANAVVFALMTGALIRLTRPATAAIVTPSMSESQQATEGQAGARPWAVASRRLIAGVAVPLCVVWAAFTWRQWQAAAAYHRIYPDLRLRSLITAAAEPAGGESLRLTQRAAALAPEVPQFQVGLGEQLVARALDESTSDSEAAGLLDAAIVAYIRSLWAAPLQPRALLGLVAAAEPIYEPNPGSEPGVLYDLVGRAAALAPHEAGLQLTVAEWYLDRWDSIPEMRRAEARSRVEAALSVAEMGAELQSQLSSVKAKCRHTAGDVRGC